MIEMVMGEPFQYHPIGKKTLRIPLTEKYTIKKVKPLHRITLPLAHHKTMKKNCKNKEKIGEINTDEFYIIRIFYLQKALLCIGLLCLKVVCFRWFVAPRILRKLLNNQPYHSVYLEKFQKKIRKIPAGLR